MQEPSFNHDFGAYVIYIVRYWAPYMKDPDTREDLHGFTSMDLAMEYVRNEGGVFYSKPSERCMSAKAWSEDEDGGEYSIEPLVLDDPDYIKPEPTV